MAAEPILAEELEAALTQFRSLLDRADIDARQTHPPTTIYTPWGRGRLAAKQAGLKPRRLSFNGSWSLVRVILLQPADWTAEEYLKAFRHVLRGCAQRKIPNRPGRHYPRQTLRRSRKYPYRARLPD